jgi:5-methylcytosine-specific restriction protein A
MAFSEDTKRQALRRAGGRCECTRTSHRHSGGRCNAPLQPGQWHAHHRTAEAAGGSDSLSNCEALCIPCHEATDTYGTTS